MTLQSSLPYIIIFTADEKVCSITEWPSTYSPLDDRWVILSTTKAFIYFWTRQDEIRRAIDAPYIVE